MHMESAEPGMGNDISERKRVKDHIKTLSLRNEAILASVPDIIMEVDENKVYNWANKAGIQFFGDDVVGKEASYYFEGEQKTYEMVKPLFEGSEDIFYVESWQRRKDGEKRLLAWWCRVLKDSKGNVLGALSTARDITERKQMEKALRKAKDELEIRVKERIAELEEANKELKAEITERKLTEEALFISEERYRTMIENSNDMIWTLDTEGRYQFVNKRVEEFSGLKLDNFLGKSFTPFIDKKDLPKVIDCFHKALNGEPQQYDVSVRNEDGNNFFLSVNTAPIYSKEKVVGTVSFGRDITDRKKTEEIRLENERLLLANKTKSVFIDTVNHELRTPLTSIIGFAEILKDKTIAGKLNEKQERFVHKILSNSSHLLELINDLLDLSKIDAGKTELVIEKFSVPAAIDEAVTSIEEMAAKRNITIRNEREPLDIEADKRKFKQIILNLLNNAVKFSKSGGGIVTISAKKSGDMAQISVSDTGIGIKKDDLEKLFWAFEQLESGNSRNYGGTGLGLTISKRLVELHGGTIEVESKYGEGSTFTLNFPLRL